MSAKDEAYTLNSMLLTRTLLCGLFLAGALAPSQMIGQDAPVDPEIDPYLHSLIKEAKPSEATRKLEEEGKEEWFVNQKKNTVYKRPARPEPHYIFDAFEAQRKTAMEGQ